ncbi:hypothetical protein CI1B_76170 [Bradyrhizobium ivorense]|uniref:Acid shock protein n=1 Tax=Bradyrhizobium ivorense TaxID=2511166 RepID=A0A508TWE6_9BRAD|nr:MULTISPECIES: hypothetical protein [Bradyrhizobium]MCC8940043.1 hypothetical protein [Bradyrhizobium ivorense]QOZ27851.1 hypothetical protein XH93_32725 [Bradyrhizobium sp. CCBAU 51753]VIO78566.1 hypothetical protein CI41S_64070 [Bradyrhizobium ivorense]VIO78975.1 hypothetical protein CI1B_76170 [Bradyrhizobium ivorense]
MRTLILAATALAFVSSTALAQDKAGSPAPAAQSGDTMSKGEASKMAPKKAKKTAKNTAKKSGAKSGEDATKQ